MATAPGRRRPGATSPTRRARAEPSGDAAARPATAAAWTWTSTRPNTPRSRTSRPRVSRRWAGRSERRADGLDRDGGGTGFVARVQVHFGVDAPVVVAGRVVEDLPHLPQPRA